MRWKGERFARLVRVTILSPPWISALCGLDITSYSFLLFSAI
jgi:hypothetical protein